VRSRNGLLATATPRTADRAYAAELGEIAEQHGITHWGIAPADVLHRARAALEDRKAAGLSDSMQFTYRNPQRSTDPGAAVQGARSIFVGALPYLAERPPASDTTSARVARYAWTDYYGQLRAGLNAVKRQLRADGWRSVAFADDNSIVDREVAALAGLGWFGKNANLLIRGAGSWFVLGSVVTAAPLPVNQVPVADGCGSCVRCIDACPTNAIVAPGVVDARRCLSWVLQRPGVIPHDMRTAVGDRIYGCDDCQEVCPPSVHLGAKFTQQIDDARTWLPLVELLDADDDGVEQMWDRWYLADRQPRWARRNAVVVLGNIASSDDHRVIALLQRYAAAADEVLAEHARWALDRIAERGRS